MATRKQEPIGSGSRKGETSDAIVDHISQGILDGRFVPGQRLVEGDFTQMFGVSRGPVREAFRRLESVGILSRTLHRSAHIRMMSRDEAGDLLQAVEPLTGLIAKLAGDAVARKPTAPVMESIRRSLAPYRNEVEDAANLLTQRRHFYDVLIMIGGNTEIGSIHPALRIHMLRLQFAPLLGSAEERISHIKAYAMIADAVLKGDGRRAEKLTRQHIRGVRERIMLLPDSRLLKTS